MKDDLTPNQEEFAWAFVETGSATEAYRHAYSTENMKPATVHRCAHEARIHPKISARIKEIRRERAIANGVTIDDLIAELDESRNAALTAGNAAASVAATMGKAKLLGFDLSKVEMSGKNGGPIEVAATLDVSKLSNATLMELLAAKDAADKR